MSSLFGRRGYNIDSLTVSATTDPKVSRMSIIVQGDEPILEQIIKQLLKLEEVQRVDHLQEDESCCSELVFVKLRAGERQRGATLSVSFVICMLRILWNPPSRR